MVSSLLFVAPRFAQGQLDGVRWVELKVQELLYKVPLYNPKIEHDMYMVQMALMGDMVARQFVLGGEDSRMIFIGDGEIIRWLEITKDGERVIEP